MTSNAQRPQRPPPPPRRGPPVPASAGATSALSEEHRRALSGEALGLLTEQLTARVVHYRAELTTNAELDAITAQVVAQVKALQDVAGRGQIPARPPEVIEGEQAQALSALLRRFLGRSGKNELVSHWIGPLGKRVAKLFFESELHERTKGDKERVIRSAAQGICYVLGRYAHRLRADLEGFDYVDTEVRQATLDRLEQLEVDFRMEFLSRRSPELNRVMAVFTEVLTEFLAEVLGSDPDTFARNVVRRSGVARFPGSVGHKIHREAFTEFRAAWEHEWMELWVSFAADRFVSRLQAENEPFMDETVAFFTDAHLYSETSVVICEASYDYLCQEGYLDLPLDWRVQLNSR